MRPDIAAEVIAEGRRKPGAAVSRAEKSRARIEKMRRIDNQNDDIVTAIRKLGGINTDRESDWRGRLSHLNGRDKRPGLPGIEQKGDAGLSLDELAEKLTEQGYIGTPDDAYDQSELADLLSRAEMGEPVYGKAPAGNALARAAADYDDRYADTGEPADAAEIETGAPTPPTPDDDMAPAGSGRRYEDTAYRPDWESETRSLAEWHEQASDVDADAADDILSSGANDATVVRRLQEIIDNGRQGPQRSEQEPALSRGQGAGARDPAQDGRDSAAQAAQEEPPALGEEQLGLDLVNGDPYGDLFNTPGTQGPDQKRTAPETRPGSTDTQKDAGRGAYRELARRVFGASNRRRRASVLGLRLLNNFRAGKPNRLTGQTVSTPADLAALAQVYRDPRFETLRVFFTRGDTVVAENAYTSRMAAAVRFNRDFFAEVAADKARHGADGYYVLHNHPSGRPDPSNNDRRFTRDLARAVGGFRSHVVIDHNQYGVLDRQGQTRTARLATPNESPTAGNVGESETAKALLGDKITSTALLAEMAKRIEADPNQVVIATTTAPGEVQGIFAVPVQWLADPRVKKNRRGGAELARLMRETGSGGRRFLIVPEGVPAAHVDAIRSNAQKRRLSGAFTDVVLPGGESLAQTGVIPANPPRDNNRNRSYRIAENNAYNPNGDLFGDDTRDAQALADEKRRRDARRSPNTDVPADSDGGLFARQSKDIEAADARADQGALARNEPLYVLFDGRRYPVASIKDAQDKWNAFRQTADFGASQQSGLAVYRDARKVARISYNGRAWDNRGNEIGVREHASGNDPAGNRRQGVSDTGEAPTTRALGQLYDAAGAPYADSVQERKSARPIRAYPITRAEADQLKGLPGVFRYTTRGPDTRGDQGWFIDDQKAMGQRWEHGRQQRRGRGPGLSTQVSDAQNDVLGAAMAREQVEFSHNVGDNGDTRWYRVRKAGEKPTPRTDDNQPLFSRPESSDPDAAEARRQIARVRADNAETLRAHREHGKPLPAPNGSASNLTEHQWVHARTPNFRAWFGDWLGAARLASLRNMVPVTITQSARTDLSTRDAKRTLRETYRGFQQLPADALPRTRDNRVVHFSAIGFHETTRHAADRRVMQVIPQLPDLLRKATPAWSEPPKQGAKPGIRAVHNYAVKAAFADGSQAYVRLVLREQADGTYYYDNDATTIEAIEKTLGEPPSNTERQSRAERTGLEPENKLAQWAQRVNAADVSQIVDENGEPRVVYHGTGTDFESFLEWAWGATDPKLANIYAEARDAWGGAANIVAGFMRASRPFDADRLPNSVTADRFFSALLEQSNASRKDVLRDLLATVKKSARREESGPHYGRQDFWFEAESGFGEDGAKAIREALHVAGFDGIQMTESGTTTYGVPQSSQFKSATGNRGTYSRDDERVSYSRPAVNDLGLFSAAEKAVLDMRLPGWKKDDGAEPGKAIWQKLVKAEGVKNEELDTLGLREFLHAGDKFTRDQVAAFIRANGVNVEEVVADSEPREEGLDWDDGEIWDDPEAWQHDAVDMLYDFDRGESDGLFGDIDEWMAEWLEENVDDDALIEHYEPGVDAEALSDEERAEKLDAIRDNENPQMDFRQKARADFEEAADDRARDYYFDNPMVIHTETGDSNLFIFGNDDIGFDIRAGRWASVDNIVSSDPIYSLDEARIQAEEYAREQGLISGEDDTNVARWEEYVTNGPYENYRETKLTLPDVTGDFYADAHFPDRNVVAFTRVTDRDLPVAPTSPAAERVIIEPDVRIERLDDNTRRATLVDRDGAPFFAQNVRNDKTDAELRELGLEQLSSPDLSLRGIRGQLTVNADGQLVETSGGTQDIANTYFIDEFQSDWHQAGRKYGYEGAPPQDVDALPKGYRVEIAPATDAHLNRPVQLFNPKGNHVASLDGFDADADIDSPEVQQAAVEAYNEAKATEWHRNAVADAPFKNDAWMALGVKRAILQAIEAGREAIAWADSNVLADRWSERYRDLYEIQYDRKMPSLVKKLAKQKPVHLTLHGDPWAESADPELEQTLQEVADEEAELEDRIKAAVAEDTGNENPTDADVQRWMSRDGAAQAEFRSALGSVRHRRDEIARQKQRDKPEGYWIVPITDELKQQVAGGFPMFARQAKEPASDAQGTRRVAAIEKNLADTLGRVRAHINVEVSAAAPETIFGANARGAEGVYDRAYNHGEGRIMLFGRNIATPQRAMQVLRHETIGHFGMERILGAKFAPALAQVRRLARDNGEVAAIAQRVRDRYDVGAPNGLDENSDQFVQEVIAAMAEEKVDLPVMRRIMAHVRAFLRRLGLAPGDITRDELHALIAQAARHVQGRAAPATQAAAGQAAFSQSAMKSVAANIRRGRKAMNKALTDKTSVHRAMYRNDLGWVDFAWGDEGGPIKASGKRKGAKGISHILEARQRKQGYDRAQTVRFLIDRVPAAIARGEIVDRTTPDRKGAQTLVIETPSERVLLAKRDGSNAWTVSAYRPKPGAARAGSVATGATQPGSTTTRTGLGAGLDTSIGNPDDDNNTPLFSRPVKQTDVRLVGRNENGGTRAAAKVENGEWSVVTFTPDMLGYGVRRFKKRADAEQFMATQGLAVDLHAPARANAPSQADLTDHSVELPAAGRLTSAARTARYMAQDKFEAWVRLQDQVEKRTGEELADTSNVRMAETAYQGRTRARVDAFDESDVDPLLGAIQKTRFRLDKIGDYVADLDADLAERFGHLSAVDAWLYARHAPEANARLEKINPGEAAMSGMSDEQAARIMAALDAQGEGAALADVAARVDAITAKTRAVLVDSGLEKQALMDQWAAMYDHYVPLKGEAGGPSETSDAAPATRSGRGFDTRGKPSQQRLGRQSAAQNILTNVVANHYQTIQRGQKNRVAQTLLRFAQQNPSSLYEVNTPRTRRTIDPVTGLVTTTGDPGAAQDDYSQNIRWPRRPPICLSAGQR